MRRALKWVAVGLFALCAFVVLAAVTAVSYLSTNEGSERARAFAMQKANEALSGTLTVGALRFGGNRLVLQDVVLLDPAGERVASVETLDVRVALSALVRKTLEISALEVQQPQLFLVQDAEGSNLSRALAPRSPQEPKPKEDSGKSPFGLVVERLLIDRGLLSIDQPERQTRVEALHLEGSLSAGEELEAALKLTAAMKAPLKGPIAVSIEGSKRSLTMRADAVGAKLRARAQLEASAVTLETLELPADLIRAFVPSYPLLPPLVVRGTASRAKEELTADLHLGAASAKVSAAGTWNLAAMRSPGVVVKVSDVNLEELVASGPASRLALELRARGGGKSLETAEGELHVTAPSAPVAGSAFGPVEVHAAADRGTFTLRQLLAVLPGVRLDASGGGSLDNVDISGTLRATDLAVFARTLGTLAGPSGLALSGKGQLDFRVAGPLKAPGVVANGQFPVLAYDAHRLQGLSLSARVPSVKDPLHSQAQVQVKQLRTGEKRFESVALALKSSEQGVLLTASTRGDATVDLRLEGQPDEDREGLLLSQLQLSYPGADWRLGRPAQLRFGGGALSVTPLSLRAGEQSLFLEGEKRGERVSAAVRVERFDLGKLPHALMDPELKLAGVLDVDATVKGRLPLPQLAAKVDLRDGRVREYSGLEVHLKSTYAGDRAKGTMQANGQGLSLDADFDTPVLGLMKGHRKPTRVNATLAELKLDETLERLGKGPLLKGVASLKLQLSGMADDPTLQLTATGRDVRYEQVPPVNFTVSATSTREEKLRMRVDVETLGRKSFVDAKAPWSLGRLIQRPPTQQQALRAPVEVDLEVKQFPLPVAYTAQLTDVAVLGTVTAKARVRGSALAPLGTVDVRVDGLTTGSAKPSSVEVHANASNDRVTVQASAEHEARKILSLDALLDAPVSSLKSLRDVLAAPVRLSAKLDAVPVAVLQGLAGAKDEQGRESPRLAGVVDARLEARGPFTAPRLSLDSKVKGLGLEGGKAAGDVEVTYRYADAKNAVRAALRSPNGGGLTVQADAPVELSYAAIQRGLQVASIPVEAKLEAKDFDPSFLSGVTEALIDVGGLLAANATLTGTVGAPKVEGRLQWNQGRLHVAGNGEMKDIALALTGNNDRVALEKLFVRSGAGKLEATAAANHKSDGFDVKLQAKAEKFPVFSEDQLLATVSLRADAEGRASNTLVDLRPLRIHEANVELPEVKRKNLQKLDDPKDLVFVRNGVPVENGKKGVGGSGPAPAKAPMKLTALIEAPRNLWVHGSDVTGEVGLSKGFRVEVADEPVVFGKVMLLKGRVDVMGRRFDVDKDSVVTMTGPVMNPNVNVVAIHTNEREEVTVYLRVQGSADDLKVVPTSQPALSETEIFTLLATGKRSLRPGSGAASNANPAASFIGSLAATQLKKTLAGALPLDVLSIEAGDGGLEGTRLEAGTYLTERIYLGYKGEIGADMQKRKNANAVRFELQLFKRWSLEAEYGDAKVGSADMIWRTDY